MRLRKKALITGVTGQDGTYLSELLLEKGYEVHGIKRRTSMFNTARIDHLYEDPHQDHRRFYLHFGDLSDSLNLTRLISEIKPDEIYNLGAQTHVKVSFETPEYTADVNGTGVLRILEAIRILGREKQTKFYQASTSELYGQVKETPQTENTPFNPQSPYAVSKLYGYWITANYREAYGMFASNGILFNHESPLRGETFVTRKITRAVAKMALGLQDKMYLGNLDAQRDWGHAEDYVEAMWRILQHDKPDDWVVATGISTTVRDFVRLAFMEIGVDIAFRGEGVNEVGYVAASTNPDYYIPVGKEVINIDPRYFRPAEVEILRGDPTKANRKLGWYPKHDVLSLCSDMVKSDIDLFRQEQTLIDAGFSVRNESE